VHFVKFLSFFLLGISAFSTISLADTVFMVQLGSYESDSKANAAWDQLKEENANLLEGLSHLKSRIVLPPDNKETFRLQAGPITNRVKAKKICATLRENKDDCFVVETAMFVGEQQFDVADITPDISDITTTANATETAITAAGSSIAVGASNVLDSITNAITSPFSSDKEDDTDEVTEATAKEVLAPAEELAEAVTETEEAIEEISTTETFFPWLRRKRGAKRITRSLEAPTPIETSDIEVETVEEAEEAVEETKEEIAIVTPKRPLPKIEKPEVETQELPPTPVINKALLKQIKPVTQAPRIERPSRVRSRGLESAVIMQPLPGVKKATKPNLNRFDKPVTIAKPITPATDGSVEVAEAIPVPLSDITEATRAAGFEPKVKPNLPVFRGRKALGWRGTPSQSFLQRSLWVKLNYFETNAKATNYWNELRRKQPELTKKLRMRLTQPYSQRRNGKRVSMQLGPFIEYKDVQALCKVAGKPGLICEIQRDTGVSATKADRGAEDRPRTTSRRAVAQQKRRNIRNARTQFWAQMGSYRNRGDAMKVWGELKARHTELRGKAPHLAHPAQSSSRRTVYRLRTGPFATRNAAQTLCSDLNSDATPCIVVTH